MEMLSSGDVQMCGTAPDSHRRRRRIQDLSEHELRAKVSGVAAGGSSFIHEFISDISHYYHITVNGLADGK